MKEIKYLFILILFFTFIINVSALNEYNDIININNEENNNIVEYNNLYKEYLNLSDEEKLLIKYEPSFKYKPTTYNNKLLLRSNNNDFLIKSNIIESKYDLRTYGYNPQITNQGPLGLCWAFSFNSMLESYLLRKGLSSTNQYNFSAIASDLQQEILFKNQIVGGNYSTNNSSNNTYKNTIGIQSLSNALLNWTYFNPVLEESLGRSPINGLLKGGEYTYENIINFYIENLRNNPNNIDNLLNKLLDEIPINSFTSNNNFPFNVSAKQIISYYNDNLLVDNLVLTPALTQSVMQQVNIVKEHIYQNGAVASMTLVPSDFGSNQSDIFIHNNFYPSNLQNYIKNKEGHAFTIIGWDDEYGDVNADSVGDGAWLVQNSWGSESNVTYFYVSYYDVYVLQGIYGIIDAVNNQSNKIHNYYLSKQSYDELNNNANYEYNYYLGNSQEEIDTLKVYFNSSQEKNIYAIVNNIDNKCTSNTQKVKNGIVTLKFNNCNLSGDVKVNIYTTNQSYNSFNKNDKLHATLYTKNETSLNPIEFKLNETKSSKLYNNHIANTKESHILYDISINNDFNSELLKIEVYNQNNNIINDIRMYTNIDDFSINNSILHGKYIVLYIESILNNTNKIKIKFYYDNNIIKEEEFNIINVNIDDIDKTIKLRNPIDIITLNGIHYSYKHTLENDIDLSELSNQGQIFENGIYFNTTNLNLIAKGNSIQNINNNGGLFNTLNNSSIKQLQLSNIITNNNNFNGIIANEGINNNIDTIRILNSSVNGDISGSIFGKNTNSSIENAILENVTVNGITASGAINGLIYHDYYLNNNNIDLDINNIFIDNVTLNSNIKAIISPGSIIINDNNSYYNKQININNITYLGLPNEEYFTNFNVFKYNGQIHNPLSNINNYYNIYNSSSINNNDINRIEDIFIPNNLIWNIKNNNKPEIKLFNENYIYIPLKDKLSKYGTIYLNEYYVINPIENINNFINKDDFQIEFVTISYDEELYNTKNNINNELIIVNDEKETQTYRIVIKGDVNSDGKIDILDFKLISNYLISDKPQNIINNYYEIYSGDINLDGIIDILDFRKVSNYLLTNDF